MTNAELAKEFRRVLDAYDVRAAEEQRDVAYLP